jgi:hypothetical protein
VQVLRLSSRLLIALAVLALLSLAVAAPCGATGGHVDYISVSYTDPSGQSHDHVQLHRDATIYVSPGLSIGTAVVRDGTGTSPYSFGVSCAACGQQNRTGNYSYWYFYCTQIQPGSNTIRLFVDSDTCSFTAIAQNTPPPNYLLFENPDYYHVGQSMISFLCADMNSDGMDDLVLADRYGRRVAIWGGLPDGSFALRAEVDAAGQPVALTVADFNHDTALDVAVALEEVNRIQIFLGDRGSHLTPLPSFSACPSITSIEHGDFDEDGIEDLAAANSTTGLSRIHVFKGLGDAAFQEIGSYSVGDRIGAHNIVVHDFLRNGHLDIAVALTNGCAVRILSGTGNGVFSVGPAISPSPTLYALGPLEGGYLNQDGYLDLFSVNNNSSGYVSFLANPTDPETFALDAHANVEGWKTPSGTVIGDYTGDGLADVAVCDYGIDSVTVLAGDGQGRFQQLAPRYPALNAYAISAGDFNGDGIKDLAVASSSSGDIGIMFGKQPSNSEIVNFASLQMGESSSRVVGIVNRSALPETLGTFEAPGNPFYFTQGFVDSMATTIVLVPGERIRTWMRFEPTTPGTFSRTASYTVSDQADPRRMDFSGTASPLGVTWSSSDDFSHRELEIGDSAYIKMTMADFTVADSLVLWFAPSRSDAFTRRQMSLIRDDARNDLYAAWIPPTANSPRGIEFYVDVFRGRAVARFPAGASRFTLRCGVDNAQFPSKQPPMRYTMISFPLQLWDRSQVFTVLGDNLPGIRGVGWRMFARDEESVTGGLSGYRELEAEGSEAYLRQGHAYWLVTRESVLLDTGPAYGISTPVDSAFALPLQPGWNMIGNPFAFPVLWDSIQVNDVGMTEQGVVRGPYWWSDSSQGYEDSVRVLEPFDGYWVQNLETEKVVLHIPPVPAREEPSGGMKDRSAALKDGAWQIRVAASACGLEDRCNYARAIRGASVGLDPFDQGEPPTVPGRSLSLRFYVAGPDSGAGPLAVDAQGLEASAGESAELRKVSGGGSYRWAFDVAKSFDDDGAADLVRLECTPSEGFPEKGELVLIDRALGRAVDVKTDPRYQFCLGKSEGASRSEDCRFLLLAGIGTAIETQRRILAADPKMPRLYPGFPNPSKAGVVLRYDLSRRAQVQLRIYDVHGALVRMLDLGSQRAGRYEVPWNGANDAGRRVAAGIYLCRLQAGGYGSSCKLELIH